MTVVIALTPAGKVLAERLVTASGDLQLLYRPKPFQSQVQDLFTAGHRLIFICATGIVVRTLAPVLRDKRRDPPVLVLDEDGRFVIPLLSGHEGGANAWGEQVAASLQAQLVLTTASSYLHPVYVLGMGCERHCPLPVLEELAQACLHQAGLMEHDIRGLASIDIKADEKGLLDFALARRWPFTTWSAARLREVEAQLTQRSEVVFREVGVYGVAEAAALVAASSLTGTPAELVLAKQKNRRATCAIARSYPKRTGEAAHFPKETMPGR